MRFFAAGLAALSFTTAAHAGGIDRTALPLSILFDAGTTAHLGFSSVTPDVSGTYNGPITFFGPKTENMAQSYRTLSFGIKADLNDKFSFALLAGQPYGADAFYTAGGYKGLEAHWTSTEFDGILKYKATDRISVYGGLRRVTSRADIFIPPVLLGGATYQAVADSNSQTGYLVGASYEVPDIALRASLTYSSAITHDFATSELLTLPGGGGGGGGEDSRAAPPPLVGGVNSTTKIILPQSVTFDMQTGIAANTLLFGSIKWAEWSKWQVQPTVYDHLPPPAGGPVTGFDNDVFTYQIGIGRKINDNLSLFARIGYEKASGGTASRLSPTDGMQSIGIGGSWTQGNAKFTGGIEYVKLGKAEDGSGTQFSGNSALGVGVAVDFAF